MSRPGASALTRGPEAWDVLEPAGSPADDLNGKWIPCKGAEVQAGYGAEDQVSRKARRIAALQAAQAAAGAVDAEVEARLARAQEDKRRWAQGAEGERLVAQALVPLQRYGWYALHDVHWPGRPLANIDHIAIGPGGVFVIDAKNWSGDVAVRDGELRQNGYRQTAKAIAAQEATQAVTALLEPQHRSAVAAVICLAAQDHVPTRAEPGIVVVGLHQLGSMLVGVEPRLTPFDVADLSRHLYRMLGGEKSPALMTTQALDRSSLRVSPSSKRGKRTSRRPAPTAAASLPRRPSASRRSRTRHGAGSVLPRFALSVGILWAFLAFVERTLETMAS